MKTKTKLLLTAMAAMSLCTLQHVHAQDTPPYWSLAGNSKAMVNSKLGTTNAIPLRLFTDNQPRIHINANGRVGIGTEAPASHVSVARPTTSPAGLATADFRATSIGSNISWVHFGATGDWFLRSAATNGKVILQDQSPQGRVGIGTASPGSFFSLVRPSAASVGLATADFRSPALGSNISWIHFGPKGDWQIRSAANDGNIILQDQAFNAKVGIGTAIPARKLEIKDGDVRIKGTNTTRFLEFIDDAPSHADYRFEHARPLDDDLGLSYLFIKSSNNNFASNNVNLAFFAAPEVSSYRFSVAGKSIGSAWHVSDARLKKDIEEVSSALSIVNKLKAKTYVYKSEEYKVLGLPKEKQYGFLAQDIERILPELVTTSFEPIATDDRGNIKKEELKTINYTELIPILTKAIQEQQAQIEELKQQVSKLSGSKAVGAIERSSSKSTYVILQPATVGQNIPNPLSASTTIPYSIPDDAKKAQLLIRDGVGNIIKQVPLAAGVGELMIDANALGSGMYTYSLIVDGSLIETKKMLVVK